MHRLVVRLITASDKCGYLLDTSAVLIVVLTQACLDITGLGLAWWKLRRGHVLQ